MNSITLRRLNITSLPPLPEGLQMLICDNINITELPALPSTLEGLICQDIMIRELPTVPDSLIYLWFQNTLLPVDTREGETVKSFVKRLESYSSKERSLARCAALKEELMATAWAPPRGARWLEAGGFEAFEE